MTDDILWGLRNTGLSIVLSGVPCIHLYIDLDYCYSMISNGILQTNYCSKYNQNFSLQQKPLHCDLNENLITILYNNYIVNAWRYYYKKKTKTVRAIRIGYWNRYYSNKVSRNKLYLIIWWASRKCYRCGADFFSDFCRRPTGS